VYVIGKEFGISLCKLFNIDHQHVSWMEIIIPVADPVIVRVHRFIDAKEVEEIYKLLEGKQLERV